MKKHQKKKNELNLTIKHFYLYYKLKQKDDSMYSVHSLGRELETGF